MSKTRDWVARTAVMVVLDETDRCVACTCALCAAKKTSLCSRACLQHMTLHCWALGQCIRFFASIPIHRAVQSALLFLTNVLCSLGPWHQTAPLCDVTVHVITTHLIWVLLSKLLGRLYCRPHCYFFTCNNSYSQPRLKSWRGPQMAILLLFLLHPYSFPDSRYRCTHVSPIPLLTSHSFCQFKFS